MKYYYLYNLKIISDFEIYGLRERVWSGNHDVHIKIGHVSEKGLNNPLTQGKICHINKNLLWLEIPKIARYLVSHGSQITVELLTNENNPKLSLYLLGSCFGALLQQRSSLILHASAIEFEGKALIFCGASGIGKSTLAATFLKNGYPVLSDDICLIEGNKIVLGTNTLYLYEDSLVHLKLNQKISNLPSLKELKKPFESTTNHKNTNIAAIYLIDRSTLNYVSIHCLSGFDKVNQLYKNLYRPEFLDGLKKRDIYFKMLCHLAMKIPVKTILRPINYFCPQHLFNAIRNEELNAKPYIRNSHPS